MAIASRTPSPAISDTSLSSSGVLLPCQYSLPHTREAEKKNDKPSKSVSKRKTNNNKSMDKVMNSKAMKNLPQGTKTGKRGSRSASLKTEEEDELVSSTGSVTRILDNLRLTSSLEPRPRLSKSARDYVSQQGCGKSC